MYLKYLSLYQLNRLRGTKSIYAKVVAIYLGLIFGFTTMNPYIGLAISVGYLAGESMGWGNWIGQQCGSPLVCGDEGEKNGIKKIASKFAPCGTDRYNKIALVIRGSYWWIPTLTPLMFALDPTLVIMAILTLSFGFQISLDWSTGEGKTKWNNAEYIYGGVQDVVLLLLTLAIVFN